MRLAFLIAYIILGATDFFDGLIARRFHLVTDLGKTLDSIADLFFYISTAWFIHRFYAAYLAPNMILLIAFLGLLVVSFIISAILCKKPILMHTSILRFNALLIYFLVISSYFVNTTYFIRVILVLFLIGITEEILIFIKYGAVDPDTTTIFALMRQDEDSPLKETITEN